MTKTRKPKTATTTEERIAKERPDPVCDVSGGVRPKSIETPISVIAAEEEVTVIFDVEICLSCGGFFHTTAQEVRFMYPQGPCSCTFCMTCDQRLLESDAKVTNKQGSFCYGCAFGLAND